MDCRPQKQIRRQWQILMLLAGVRYGFTLEQLAERAHVTGRTVRRDLEVLIDAGFPIERNHEGEGIAIRFVWGADVPRQLGRLAEAYDALVDANTGTPSTRG